MDSAAISAAEPFDGGEVIDPGTIAEVQTQFREWIEAFTGETLVNDEAVIDAVAGLIATAETEALELLDERLNALLFELVSVAEQTGEELSDAYFSSIEGVIAAIDVRLTPAVMPDHAEPAAE